MTRRKIIVLFASLAAGVAAATSDGFAEGALLQAVPNRIVCQLPPLPVAHSNNAVAGYDSPAGPVLFSFMGLKAGKTYQDISKAAYMLRVGEGGWIQIPDVPVPEGRLAATAQVVNGKVYIFGGYSVSEDGSERSEPDVFAFDPETLSWERRADMPLPVDDTVSFTYQDRYIYLVSGWHNVGNLNQVQAYDTRNDTWLDEVTQFAGKAVFGHSGAAIDNRFVIIDGVAVTGIQDGKRTFALWPQAYEGTIDPNDPRLISWIRLPAFDRPPMYRAAAIGDSVRGRVIFSGGSSTAYNIDGVGYNGRPAQPIADTIAWNISARRWERMDDTVAATMDHRGLVQVGDGFYTIGGMESDQQVTGAVYPVIASTACDTS